MAKKDNIFFELWNPTGLINQVMSLEIAVGLSSITKKQLIVHHMTNNDNKLYDFKKVPIYTPSTWNNDQRKDFTDREQFPQLAELVDWNENLILIDEKINYFPQEEKQIKNTCLEYYFSNETEMSDDEIAFADGRQSGKHQRARRVSSIARYHRQLGKPIVRGAS
jgi:hypothetical protein